MLTYAKYHGRRRIVGSGRIILDVEAVSLIQSKIGAITHNQANLVTFSIFSKKNSNLPLKVAMFIHFYDFL